MLVAYFSVTHHTEGIAKLAAEHLGCDLFEIEPVDEYTAEDIDYNADCRANREQNDPTARPKIRYTIPDVSQYEAIVLGYPIWWGQAPKIMYTFVESHDLTGVTILPFCTSGSSPIGSSATNLATSAPEANWLPGRRFGANAGKEEVGAWLDESIPEEETMNLFIDDTEVNITWEDNPSVGALSDLATDGLTIAMHEYGGFEQTGPIGHSLPREDHEIDVVPGDIVLYQGNQISVFYNPSRWSYTRLGHIKASGETLEGLLKKDGIKFRLQK